MPSIQIPQELVNQIIASTPALINQTLANILIAPDALQALESKFNNLAETLVTEKVAELKEAQSLDVIQDEKLQKNVLSGQEIDEAFLSIQETVVKEITNFVEQFSNEFANRSVEVNSLSQQDFNNFISSFTDHIDLSVEEVWKDGVHNLEAQSENFQNSIQQITKQLDNTKPKHVAEFLQNQYRNSGLFQVNIEQAQLDALSLLDYDEFSEVNSLVATLSKKEKVLDELRDRNYQSVDERYAVIDEPQVEVGRLKFDCFLSMALAQNQLRDKIEAAYEAIETDIQNLASNSVAKRNIEQFITDVRNGVEDPKITNKPVRSRQDPWREKNIEKSEISEIANTLDFHMQGRFKNLLNALEAVYDLKEQNLVSGNTLVEAKGAEYQFIRGKNIDQTQAAHHLPRQIYLDGEKLSDLVKGLDEGELYSLSLSGQAGATSVMDKYINDVDTLWERNGLVRAFEKSIGSILDSRLDSGLALNEAFDRLRQDSLEALNKTEESIKQNNRFTAEQSNKMVQIVREYQDHLENLKYEELRKWAINAY